MEFEDIMDQMAHEFLLVKIKRELETVRDPDVLKSMVLQLVDLIERQKGMFKQMMFDLIDAAEGDGRNN